MSTPVHTELATGRWGTLTLSEQLGNIGSEVYRAARAQDKNEQRFNNALTRAFELIDLTLADTRHKGRLYEIARMREAVADAVTGGKEYGTTLDSLEAYFNHFAFSARLHSGA